MGRWQGTNTLGAFCEAVFSADGRFSSVMQSAWGPVHQRGVYKIVDDKTIWFGSVPDTHIQVLPGSNGQLVASNVQGFPQGERLLPIPGRPNDGYRLHCHARHFHHLHEGGLKGFGTEIAPTSKR